MGYLLLFLFEKAPFTSSTPRLHSATFAVNLAAMLMTTGKKSATVVICKVKVPFFDLSENDVYE